MEEVQLSLKECKAAINSLLALPLDYGESQESSLNKKVVGLVTLISKFISYHGFDSKEEEFEFYYRVVKKLVNRREFDSNLSFVIRKLLSLLNYVIENDTPYVAYYSTNPQDKMDDDCVNFLNTNANLISVTIFLLLIYYKMKDSSMISLLQEFQGFDILSKILVDYYNRSKCNELTAHSSIYKNTMELLYGFCKDVKLSSEELNSVDDKFIYYLLESIRGLTKVEDESNFYKFKIVIILNEQYMVNFYEQYETASENKVFLAFLQHEEFFRNFIDCLILNFNRETDDHVIQILILKILYLIFTTSATCQKFYLNDLKVLIDIFLRELNNLSIHDNQIPLINTYLRVLYPMLLFSQLKKNKYKFAYLIEALQNLLRELDDEDSYMTTMKEELLEEVPTSKRLVLRILKHLNFDFSRTDSVSSEISNSSAFNLNNLSSKSAETPDEVNTEKFLEIPRPASRSSSIVSQSSAISNSPSSIVTKKLPPPPPPPPRRGLYKTDNSSDVSFVSIQSLAASRR